MAEVKQGLAEFVIQGPDGQMIRHQFAEGQTVRLGRAPAVGWRVAWDRTISREHADLLWQRGQLSVTCLVAAMNPIKLRGEALRSVVVGGSEVFEIGQSKFYFDRGFDPASNTKSPAAPLARETKAGPALSTAQVEFQPRDDKDEEFLEEHTYPSIELRNVSFGDAERPMEVLSNLERLNAVPDDDGPKMAKLDNTPPAGWDGAFRLDSR